jgi:hypothetical protein
MPPSTHPRSAAAATSTATYATAIEALPDPLLSRILVLAGLEDG